MNYINSNSYTNSKIRKGNIVSGEKLNHKSSWNTQQFSSVNCYQNNNQNLTRKSIAEIPLRPIVDYKDFPTIHPDPVIRPFHGIGCSCMPDSKKSLVTFSTPKLGLRNLLAVPLKVEKYYLTRWCAYLVYCTKLKVPNKYPDLSTNTVLKEKRIQDAIERTITEELLSRDESENSECGKLYKSLFVLWQTKTVRLIDNMKATLSSTLIRMVGYVLFKVFRRLFMSVIVCEGQLEMVEKACGRNVPVVFVPLHRSHVDYLLVTWVLFNRQISAPVVAAGDNLRIPIFGWLLRGLGGFFIKRKMEKDKNRKDHIYRAVLQTYVSKVLHAGYNMEFFIEGGRTRTGKPCIPKGGLLSVIVDEFLEGRVDDVLFVPIAINYDKLLDGNFIREQLGQPKVPESFWRAVYAIYKVFSTNYGHARIDFSQPFGLREFFQSSNPALRDSLISQNQSSLSNDDAEKSVVNRSQNVPWAISPNNLKGHYRSNSSPMNLQARENGNGHIGNGHDISGYNGNGHSERNGHSRNAYAPNLSNSSLRTDVSEDYQCFVANLATHIVSDAEKIQPVMSSNIVAWLLSFGFREGATVRTLADALDELVGDLQSRGRDAGFSGDSLNIVIHGVKMLGESVVLVEGCLDTQEPALVYVVAKTRLPNVIELNYYANALTPLYAIDGIVATCLLTMVEIDLWSYVDIATEYSIRESSLVDRCKMLCNILKHEFTFVPPCAQLEDRIYDAIHRLIVNGFFRKVEMNNSQSRRRVEYDEDFDSEDEDWSQAAVLLYYMSPTEKNLTSLSRFANMLSPLVDAYYGVALSLDRLLSSPCDASEFSAAVQASMRAMLDQGRLSFSESIAADSIRNAVKYFESEGIVESCSQDSLRILYLSKDYESERGVSSVLHHISSFKVK